MGRVNLRGLINSTIDRRSIDQSGNSVRHELPILERKSKRMYNCIYYGYIYCIIYVDFLALLVIIIFLTLCRPEVKCVGIPQ